MKPFISPMIALVLVGVLTLGVSTMGLSQPRLHPDSRYGTDSLRLKRLHQQALDDIVERGFKQSAPSSIRKVTFPQSEIYVIDTATVWNTNWPTRCLYSFDANAKITTDLRQQKKGDLWLDTLRWMYTCDASNNILSGVREILTNGQWISDYRHTYTYDAEKNLLSDLGEKWSSGQWVNAFRATYTYDGSNNKLSYFAESWINGQWENFERSTYTYDGSRNMLSELHETWNNKWENDYRYTYTYGASNKVLTSLSENWEWYSEKWITSFRETFTYDPSNQMVSDLCEKLKDNLWVNYERRTYEYDAHGNMTSVWSYLWTNSVWAPLTGEDYLSTYWGRYLTLSDGAGNSYQYVFCYNVSLIYRAVLPKEKERVQVWQQLTISDSGAFSSTLESNVVTIDGFRAKVIRASKDTVSVLVPPELVKNRNLTDVIPDTTVREVTVVVRVIKGVGDTVKVLEKQVLFMPPRLLIHDQVTRAEPPLRQGVLLNKGMGFVQTFMFLGYSTDGTAAVRLINTSAAFPPPIALLAKVISPPPITLFDATEWPSGGNVLSVGIQNAAIQFPIDMNGWYIVVVAGGPLPDPPVTPGGLDSPGPFPALFQIHLAGNVGLPRKEINGVNELPRGIRLDTYFNHPAPRTETLVNNNPLLGGLWAQTGLFKFANPVSISRWPVAVLIPPNLEGFPIGSPPVRARPPDPAGQIFNDGIDITTPMATTPAAVIPIPGEVLDLAQVPIPASVLYKRPPPGVARILGSPDSSSVTLPFSSPAGTLRSLILDMGSGNEIVDKSGPDFKVIAVGGRYHIAVSNTPFSDTFVEIGGGTDQCDFDLAGSGLTSARYVRLSVTGATASIEAVEALHLFTDQIHPSAGPLADVGYATITMRGAKLGDQSLDPVLELIGPDGSTLGTNDSGFGDDLYQFRSDAALIKRQLNQQGFYRFLGRGYDVRPDATAFGRYNARLETGGEYDATEIKLSTDSEAPTSAQRQGTISVPRQRDSYLFQASAGTTVNIAVSGIGAQPLADPVVELYDPDDFLIAANDDYSGRDKNAAISVPLHTIGRAYPNPSTYRIVVMGMDKATDQTTTVSNSTFYVRQANGGSYQLKVFTGPLSGEKPGAPTITGISPNAVTRGAANVIVTVVGRNFTSGTYIWFTGAPIVVNSTSFVSAGELLVDLDVDSTAAVGKCEVNVGNPDGTHTTAFGMFEVIESFGSVSLAWDAPDPNAAQAPPRNLNSVWGGKGPATMGYPAVPQVHLPKADKRIPRAIQKIADVLPGDVDVSTTKRDPINEVEPNNTISTAQRLTGDTLVILHGQAEVRDGGTLLGEGDLDDIEDLFKVTTAQPGLSIRLDGLSSDCDLYLIDPPDTSLVNKSTSSGVTPEQCDVPDLPTGTYLIGVAIYDLDPQGPDSSAYTLHVRGALADGGSTTLSSYAIYRSTVPNARITGSRVRRVSASARSWTDAIPHGGQFYYQLTAMYGESESTPSNEATAVVASLPGGKTEVPADFALLQNYPNPFNPSTAIRYELPRTSMVKLSVYDVLGREVSVLVNERKNAGSYEVKFDGRGLASGVYLYRMQAEEFIQTKRLCLIK